jgi:hypothetical protein
VWEAHHASFVLHFPSRKGAGDEPIVRRFFVHNAEAGTRHSYENLVVQDLDDYDDVEADYGDEDDDSPLEQLAYLAAGIEAGIAEVPRGWKLDRPGPGILVWTTPSGQRYASTLTGEWLPVPAIRP